MEFCNLDSNNRYLDYCGSICCSRNHHIRMSSVFFPHGEMDMNFADFAIFVKNVLTVKDLMS